MKTPDKRDQLQASLESISHQLQENELLVLINVAEGLLNGQRDIGILDVVGDGRDWALEAREEIRDSLVYIAAELERFKKLREMGAL